jgi:DNA polymerase-3 subunit alpha
MKYPGSLHCHTHYSNETLRDCINTVPGLIDLAIQLGHECVAITDHETISSYIKAEKYYNKIKKDNPDFKLIRGNEIYLTRNGLTAKNFDRNRDRYFHFILLAKDLEGYHQICELSTRAWNRSYMSRKLRRRPTYYSDLKEIVKPNQGHLIASSACLGSQLDRFLLQYMDTGDEEFYETAKRWCLYIEDIFGKGNFYLEMQPSNGKEQVFVNKQLLKISKELEIKYIITTDSHYGRPEDAAVHEAFLNSQDGEREVRSFYATTYMMSDEEIRSFFQYLSEDELQAAYSAIKEIKDRCEDFSVLKPLKIPSLPWREFGELTAQEITEYSKKMPALGNFILSSYKADNVLVDALLNGIKKHEDLQNDKAYAALNECLEMTWESSQVNKAQWSAYFLNLQKIIDECWNAGSIVLPARGSGGGFVLLYALDIIQINCLREKTKTYPWRFLNPARVSVLDIDVDIEGLRRGQVLEHLRKVYGENRVSNVATFRTEKSKSAILTAARGLGIDVDEASYIANLITTERGQAYTLKQMYYGDDEAGIEPNQTFINEVNKYPKLWKVASSIEGLICGMGIHAGGVVFKDEDFTKSSALMRAPDGTVITQFELHDLEDVSEIKMDLLSVEAADKIHTCLDLLMEQGYVEKKATLRETYEEALGVYKINRDDEKMWDMIQNHEIVSLFQMEQQSGTRGIALTHPRTVDELAVLNSVIRLMAAEKGAESPLDKYARFRFNPKDWEREMIQYGLTEEERQILHRELDISDGLSITQEQFMQLVQIPECGGWDLQFADKLRKSIAKKNPKEYEELTKQFFQRVEEKNLSRKFCDYVWNVEIALSRGYGFNASHTYAYSMVALQEMNLARFYPIIFWNTANLIVDSGGSQTIEYEEDGTASIVVDAAPDEDENEQEDLEEWEEENEVLEGAKEDKKKEKTKSVDYGKVASAIGKFSTYGIKVSPPDVNTSSFTFTPVVKDNAILYGLRGITRLSISIIKEIMEKRPFNSIEDFLERVKINKVQMSNLIKCGAFDKIEGKPREQIMAEYIDMIADKKQRLTLQNMQMLINKNLIPEDMVFYGKLFSFNKFLKTCKKGDNYELNEAAVNFIGNHFSANLINNGTEIPQSRWDNVYKNAMEPMRVFLKEHRDEMLAKLNQSLYDEMFNKYAAGNISHWEMESVSFYSHQHELAEAEHLYDDFFTLSEEPEIDYTFTGKDGNEVKIFKFHRIIGTVIDKNKMKNTVTLLTPTGVVNVKVYKSQYASYDKQLSQKGDDGVKHVLEKSWFSRGTLLMVQGIRRGADFVPKKRKDSFYPVISKIIGMRDNGILEFQTKRMEVEE